MIKKAINKPAGANKKKTQADVVREKLADKGITTADVAEAIAWARKNPAE